MIFHLIFWALKVVAGCAMCQVLLSRLQPSYATHNPARRKAALEIPNRMMTLVHAVLASGAGLGYCFYLVSLEVLYEVRVLSTAYLLFDALHNYAHKKRVTRDPLADAAAAGGGVSHVDPSILVFHHVVTVVFMHGWLFNDEISGLLAYYISEIPVITLSITWLCQYFGNQSSPLYVFASRFTVISYFVLRVCLYAFFFLFFMLPNMSFFNPLAYVAVAALFLVYGLNVIWFFKLVSKNQATLLSLFDRNQAVLRQLVPHILRYLASGTLCDASTPDPPLREATARYRSHHGNVV